MLVWFRSAAAASRRNRQREPGRKTAERREREQQCQERAADKRQRRREVRKRAGLELGDVDGHHGAVADASAVQPNASRARARRWHEVGKLAQPDAGQLLEDVARLKPDLCAAALRLELLNAKRAAAVGADAHAEKGGETFAFFER